MTKPLYTGRQTANGFEESVKIAIENKLGVKVVPQVGQSGFFIDLGIVHPKKPGEYIMGVECDGASYHSSAWARERDRQRQSILEDKGWSIFRVWSIDYFKNPTRVIQELEDAYKLALEGKLVRKKEQQVRNVERTMNIIESDSSAGNLAFKEYQACRLTVVSHAYEATQPFVLAKKVIKVVEVEGPLHEELLLIRLRNSFGLSYSSEKFRSFVADQLIQIRRQHANLNFQDGFYYFSAQMEEVKPRDRMMIRDDFPFTWIHPFELEAAILAVVSYCRGISEKELEKQIVKHLGYGSTTAKIKEILEGPIDRLVRRKALIVEDGVYTVSN